MIHNDVNSMIENLLRAARARNCRCTFHASASHSAIRTSIGCENGNKAKVSWNAIDLTLCDYKNRAMKTRLLVVFHVPGPSSVFVSVHKQPSISTSRPDDSSPPVDKSAKHLENTGLIDSR